jgi:hypothetical protein
VGTKGREFRNKEGEGIAVSRITPEYRTIDTELFPEGVVSSGIEMFFFL